METIVDENLGQETQEQYEINLERNYPPSERAGIRASDQRAAYQAATLKLNAEKEAQNIRDNSIRLGIAQAGEARAQRAETLAIKTSAAELALKDRDDKRNEMALDQAPLMLAEIEKMRGKGGYLSTADETAIRLKFPYASFSKNAGINKVWEDEGSLRRNLMATEAANSEIRTKEDRATNEKIASETRVATAAAAERARQEELAKGLPLSQVVVDGGTYKKPDLPKPKEEIPDTYVKYNADLAAVRESLGIPVAKNPKDQQPLPYDIQKQFEARGTALTKGKPTPTTTEQPQATVGNPSGMPATPATPAAPAAPAPASPAPPVPTPASSGRIDAPDVTPEQRKSMDEREARGERRVGGYWYAANELDEYGQPIKPYIPEPTPAAPAAPAAPTEAKQFASEAEARKSGAKAGDIIILINPKTGKPGRARLD